MTRPAFQHRHFVFIADTIAQLNMTDTERDLVASRFTIALRNTNPRFDEERFYAAAMGKPSNGRDKVR